ncbi:XRE family transcriptional regulator [Pseudomonas sp.]|uniref:XRE family transcriptional regulator n=1 Tax=Pseudomonas sp. TaxID=306 RepID=UPI00258C07B7|nr:XRE family transcriptional regulator [Pseudomonas sp.]
MHNISVLNALYEVESPPADARESTHPVAHLLERVGNQAQDALCKLAYLAGIKNAPADDHYRQLDTTNLSTLLSSAREAGYDVEIVKL